MPTVEAPPYFFPGWDAGTVAMTSLTFDTGSETLSLSLPVLTPDALNAVSQCLLAAQAQHLACRPIADIVEVIDCVIQLWLDPQYPYRQQAEASGYYDAANRLKDQIGELDRRVKELQRTDS